MTGIGTSYCSVVVSDPSFEQGVDSVGEFPLKSLGDRCFMNLRFNQMNYSSPNLDYDNDLEEYKHR
ncbi:hypothetical protein PTKIN_Ptkin05aG0021400 [Pterospermum kingtungense]